MSKKMLIVNLKYKKVNKVDNLYVSQAHRPEKHEVKIYYLTTLEPPKLCS